MVVCDQCGHSDRVPSVFQRRNAIEKFTARRPALHCDECDHPVVIVMAEVIPEPMRSWINKGATQ
jgi:hypothetical protein